MEQPPGTGHTLHAGERSQPRAVGGGTLLREPGPVGKGHTITLGPAACVASDPPTGKTANLHPQTRKARGGVQMAGTRSLSPWLHPWARPPEPVTSAHSQSSVTMNRGRRRTAGRRDGLREPALPPDPRKARSRGVPVTRPGSLSLGQRQRPQPHTRGKTGRQFPREMCLTEA